jgi:hypothetical protein
MFYSCYGLKKTVLEANTTPATTFKIKVKKRRKQLKIEKNLFNIVGLAFGQVILIF